MRGMARAKAAVGKVRKAIQVMKKDAKEGKGMGKGMGKEKDTEKMVEEKVMAIETRKASPANEKTTWKLNWWL